VPEVADESSGAVKVLVVDDDDAGRYLIGSILQPHGYDVTFAVDGLDALEQVAREIPDLIITDVLMPRMDGYKLCVRLRSDPGTQDVPIVVCTGSFSEPADTRFADSLGVDAFLVKPFEFDVLLAEVRRLAGGPSRPHEVLEPEDTSLLMEYGERISAKLYEKLLELEAANVRLTLATEQLGNEVAAKTAAIEELSQAVAKEQEAEAALLVSRERYAAAIRGANDGIWDWDVTSGSFFGSSTFRSLLGLTDDEPLLSMETWLVRVEPEDVERVRLEIDLHLRGLTPHFESEHRLAVGRGETRWMLARGQTLCDDDGAPYRMAGSLTDISDRKRNEEQLLRSALYDELTGLPNRNLFLDRLHFVQRRRERHSEYAYAVLFLDLDRFKTVNEAFGRAAGDLLLQEASARLSGLPGPSDTLARLGGDEFAILLDDEDDPAEAERMAARVVEALDRPFDVERRHVMLTGSVGIALSGAADCTPEELLRDAETAMFRAKEAGRARYEVFDALMHATALHALQTEEELRSALSRGELEPFFQPIVSLETGRIVSCEALVRWNHPTRGLLGPGEFVAVAEDTGLIVPMGRVVLEAACARCKAWNDAGSPDLTVAVNISARQFAQPGLLETVREVLRDTGLAPDRLTLELTESVVMSDPVGAQAVLTEMNESGVRLALDDFGTGHSSLAYLRRFPFDTLKVDRSFVMDLPNDAEGVTVVEAVVGLAHSLGKSVTAEGVETLEQCAFLRGLGCDSIQGFLVSRPVPATEFEALLAETSPGDGCWACPGAVASSLQSEGAR
jgi:diguanylate cyclase (GGDEF)-like protein/PAS domain S-box-containing protein